MAKMQGRSQGKSQQGDDRGDGLKEKLVAINRVTKVVKGGKQLRFRATVSFLHESFVVACKCDMWLKINSSSIRNQ